MTRRWWWPLGPYPVMVPAIAIVVVVLGMTWPRLGWPYPLWVQTSAQFRQQFAFAGMIAGTAACWYATVMHAKDRVWARPGAPRLGTAAAALHLTMLTGWFVGAYLIALAPLVVSTVVHNGIGTPDPLVMLSGVLAMIAAVALGYALGTVFPTVATVPVVAISFYALLVAGNIAGEPMAGVAPHLWLEPTVGERESLALVTFRIALFLAVAIAAIGLSARAMTRTRVRRSLADAAICLAVPALLVTVSLVRPPVVYTAETPVAACKEQRSIRYCVHPDNAPRLDDLIRTVDPIIARFGTKPSNIDEVRDEALAYLLSGGQPIRGVEVAWLDRDGTISTDVATAASGFNSCDWEGEFNDHQNLIIGIERDIEDYLTTGNPTESLASMSVAEVQEWLGEHQEQLHGCTLTEDQLPGVQAR